MALDLVSTLNSTLANHPRQIAQASGSNFAKVFFFLNKDQRRAIEAVYAFARVLDDAVDDWQEPSEQNFALAFWQERFEEMMYRPAESPLLRELRWAIGAFGISPVHFRDLIRGCRRDIEQNRYATFAELEAYCYDVASTIGLVCLPIFGIREEAAQAPSIALGKALQLTNILRDVGEDLSRDRIYLPREDLARFGYSLDALRMRIYNDVFYRLMDFEASRAEAYFAEAWKYLQNGWSRRYLAPRVMGKTYERVLANLRAKRFRVFDTRIGLSRFQKFVLLTQAFVRFTCARRHGD